MKEDLSGRELSVSYEPDKTILNGGCRLETKTSRVDVSMEQQLAELLEDFASQQNIPSQAQALDGGDHIPEPDKEDLAAEDSHHDTVEPTIPEVSESDAQELGVDQLEAEEEEADDE